uniref:SH3 domain-containing protein n=1 Tax=Globodera rostochiensis TaxID=31243 RepID=A0A914HG20_GLORO
MRQSPTIMTTAVVENGGGVDGASPSRRMAKDELNRAYQIMLHQRRHAVSGMSGDEAMLKSSTSKSTNTATTTTTSASVVVIVEGGKQHSENFYGNGQQQKLDEKCAAQKSRGQKKEPAKKWTSALRVVAAMTRFKNVPKAATMAGRYKSAEYLHQQQHIILGQHHQHHQQQQQQQHYHHIHHQKQKYSVRRSSLQPQQQPQHHHQYPWEHDGEANCAADVGGGGGGGRRRRLPTAPEPLKCAHSAHILTRNMVALMSSSWSNRLNKVGTQYLQQEEGVITRKSHPSLNCDNLEETKSMSMWSAHAASATMPNQECSRKSSRCAISRVLTSDQHQQHHQQKCQPNSCPIVMATSPKVKALRRGISTAVVTPRRSLISQHSLQCSIGSPKVTHKMHNRSSAPAVVHQQDKQIILSEKNQRKISAGAYFCHSSSPASLPFMPNEVFPCHYTPSTGAGSAHAIDAQSSIHAQFLLLSNKQHLANFRANSNPTICCRRGGGVERQILRRSPNSDLAPRFQHHHHNEQPQHPQQYSSHVQDECSRGSSFSNESTPGRNGPAGGSTDQDPDNIDPVYLALKQATEKYGTPAESRRGSQNVVMVDSPTPSPRDLSQTSLQDSGTYSGSGDVCGGSRQPLVAGGSTPHLQGIFAGKGLVIGNGKANEPSNGANNCQPLSGRRPKLSEKMKSLSLDCAEMPDPVQSGMMRPQYTRRFAVSSGGQQSFDKSASPHGRPQAVPTSIKPSPKRLPPVPAQQQQQQHPQRQQAVVVQPSHHQQQQQHNNNIMHIIIHDYSSGECVLHPGNRVVVVDNGDPDWKHGFKLNDCLEQLLTFPSSCVAAYHMEEQPMQLLQSCNLVEQKIRLYRDQIVFAQPNGLSGEGRLLLVRNEHNKFAHCPLHFLTLA